MWPKIPRMPGETGKLKFCVHVLDCAGWLTAEAAAALIDQELQLCYCLTREKVKLINLKETSSFMVLLSSSSLVSLF